MDLEEELARARQDPRRRVGPSLLLLAELGRGGMGVVWRAWDESARRPVAVKVLLGEADAEAARRLEREARAQARLTHPAIVPIYGAGTHAGRPYLVLALIEGASLDHRLRDPARPLALAARLGILRDVARAIDHAHGLGIVHRDLKPANVLLDRDDRPFVSDFGLARVEGQSRMTASGASVGTPAYMPPEQIEGAQVGPLADVYALGATLYHVVAGRPPFAGATPVNVMSAVLTKRADPPSRWAADVPPALDALVLRCLEKRPEDRPQGAAAVADELERLLASPAQAAARPSRRGLLALAGLAVAAGALGAGALGVGALLAPADPAATPTPPSPQPAPSTPQRPAPSTPAPATRLAWRRPLGAPVRRVVFRPDGRQVAAACADGRVSIFDASGAPVATLAPPAATEVRALAFTPDGAGLITASSLVGGEAGAQTFRTVVRRWSLGDGPAMTVVRTLDHFISDLAFLPGELLVAACEGEGGVLRLDPRTLEPGRLDLPGSDMAALGASPEGLVVSMRSAAGSRLHRLAPDLAMVNTLTIGELDARDASFGRGRLSRDGARVYAVLADRPGIVVWTPGPVLGTGGDRETLETTPRLVDLCVSDEVVAAGTTAGGLVALRLRNGKPLWSVPDAHPPRTATVEASPDGALLASGGADGSVALWRLPP